MVRREHKDTPSTADTTRVRKTAMGKARQGSREEETMLGTGSQSEGDSPARTGLDRAKEEGCGSGSILRVAKQKLAPGPMHLGSFQPSTVEGHTSRNMASAAASRGARQPRGGFADKYHTMDPWLEGALCLEGGTGPGQPWSPGRSLHGTWAVAEVTADGGRQDGWDVPAGLHKNGQQRHRALAPRASQPAR